VLGLKWDEFENLCMPDEGFETTLLIKNFYWFLNGFIVLFYCFLLNFYTDLFGLFSYAPITYFCIDLNR